MSALRRTDEGQPQPCFGSNDTFPSPSVTHVLSNAADLTVGSIDVRNIGRDMDASTMGSGGANVKVNIVLNCTSPPSIATASSRGETRKFGKDIAVDSPDVELPRAASNQGQERLIESALTTKLPTRGTFDVSLTPLENLDIPTSSSGAALPSYSELYVRGLLSSELGLPCWRPEPGNPNEQPQGVVPGDVGIYTLGSPFERIFNLWEEEATLKELAVIWSKTKYQPLSGRVATDHGILQAEGILAPTATCKSPDVDPGLLNERVQSSCFKAAYSQARDRATIVHEFVCPPKTEGAILAVLSSADLEATQDNQAMQDYILQHVEAIFRLADGKRPINDTESLYIITGCIKTDTWAMAAYGRLGKAQRKVERVFELRKKVMPETGGPTASYQWTRQGLQSQLRKGSSGPEGSKNQSLFLQGFKLAFSPSFYAQMKASLLEGSSEPAHDSPQFESGDSTVFRQSWIPPYLHGVETPSTIWQLRGQGSGRAAQPWTCHDVVTVPGFSQASTASEGIQSLLAPMYWGGVSTPAEGEGVELHQFPSPSGIPYHPSDVINQMLLKATGANVALSHDDDWRTIQRESAHAQGKSVDSLSIHDEMMHSDIPSRTISVHDGVAYVVIRHDPHKDDWATLLNRTQGLRVPSFQVKLIPSASGTRRDPQDSAFYVPIAESGFGNIYLAEMCLRSGTRMRVTVKVFHDAEKRDVEIRSEVERHCQRECDIWSTLLHPNILQFEGLVFLDELPGPGILSEYMEHGNLRKFMESRLSFDRLHMAIGIARGLEYLHSVGVVHCPLSIVNVMVQRDRRTGLFEPLIAGFGLARVLGRPETTISPGLTHRIANPPEVIASRGENVTTEVFTPASDVYNFSLILLELLAGAEPYSREGLGHYHMMGRIADLYDPLRPSPRTYPFLDPSYEFCWPIMRDCWKAKPEERISIQEAHQRLLEGYTRMT